MRADRLKELERVVERGHDVDMELVSKCAYYPLFRFVNFTDKETGEKIIGQQLVCKSCKFSEPNQKCKHAVNLMW